MDKQSLKIQRDYEDKEPGFAKLESHHQQLILNALAQPPYDSPAMTPTEFYSTFLKKKSQFKAKETLTQRFLLEKINFNPGAAFITCLWHAEFFWILPDSPSGVSIFFCPESKSINITELERECSFALIDKVKADDLEKLSKQKLYLPQSTMDLVFMTQNFYTVISLCFSESSNSAIFLLGWADHMYKNHLMYSSLQAADPSFFAKVLFAIDSALQIHWRSCCNSQDRQSVNDKVLIMQESQDMILRHSFIQQIPKSINDKIYENRDELKIPGKIPGQKFGQNRDKNSQKEIVVDSDKSHMRWRVKEGENYSNIFYWNQKKCPKTKEGKQICMTLFLRGFCNKSCICAHKRSKEEEIEFDNFVGRCREGGAPKPDF
jgi:hypothetical protein